MPIDMLTSSGSASTRDSWYRELVIRFADGTQEHFYIELTQTGTHIPKPITQPAAWTLLTHHQCPSCPLGSRNRYCPAAESLESTLLRLQDHYSHEKVSARAIDWAGRETSVNQPLQDVGTVLVHLAVFSSGCPVGKQFRPMLNDMRPFATNPELTRHLVQKILLKHRGQIEASRQDTVNRLQPLREVFANLCRRLPVDSKGDAMANAIISVDASTWTIALEIDQALDELASELGLDVGESDPSRATATRQTSVRPQPSLWQRLISIFHHDRR